MNNRILEQKAVSLFQNFTIQETDGWEFTGRSFFNIELQAFIGEFRKGIQGKNERRNMALLVSELDTTQLPAINWLQEDKDV